jgi:hypothetical protein
LGAIPSVAASARVDGRRAGRQDAVAHRPPRPVDDLTVHRHTRGAVDPHREIEVGAHRRVPAAGRGYHTAANPRTGIDGVVDHR